MADDGWTSVPRGKKSRKPQPLTGAPAPSRNLTVEDITRDFDAKTKQWRLTACRKQLIKQVDWAVGAREDALTIERYVCIGSGSLSRDNVECRRRSMWQIVVFLDLATYLVDRNRLSHSQRSGSDEDGAGASHCIWASDPAYTELDTAFLLTKGVEVVPIGRTDMGFGGMRQHLREGTLLYEPFVDMNAHMVKDMVDAEVALYIGSSIGGLKERQSDVGELAKTFCIGKSVRTFPSFDVDPNIFDGMTIYWKEESHD
ncbi:Putative SRR1-like domain-containing protein [Septoria linicola]|uniref:SRR1-like domain-containing protein n=1 Tax=Septoria linicola TaxID=215465 RepID=A0A9Q9EIA6_9PEZI|nr:putative SRR1-like domain-containing protein [Septoria linicola]USW52606.1 Putative SRR1-like domain-containing protein [Septoria linicola]